MTILDPKFIRFKCEKDGKEAICIIIPETKKLQVLIIEKKSEPLNNENEAMDYIHKELS